MKRRRRQLLKWIKWKFNFSKLHSFIHSICWLFCVKRSSFSLSLHFQNLIRTHWNTVCTTVKLKRFGASVRKMCNAIEFRDGTLTDAMIQFSMDGDGNGDGYCAITPWAIINFFQKYSVTRRPSIYLCVECTRSTLLCTILGFFGFRQR